MLFRVWCENNREWETDNCSIDAYGNIRDGWTAVRPETHKVEFSTGLKDADGHEIFQGDIVEGHLHSQWYHGIIRCIVAWNETSACFECREPIPNTDGEYYVHKVKFSKDVKVIGNIHETESTDDMKFRIKER